MTVVLGTLVAQPQPPGPIVGPIIARPLMHATSVEAWCDALGERIKSLLGEIGRLFIEALVTIKNGFCLVAQTICAHTYRLSFDFLSAEAASSVSMASGVRPT